MTVQAGPHAIYAVVDPGNDIAESNENNNNTFTPPGQELFIAYWPEISVDSGKASGQEADVAYSAVVGYGYENGNSFTWGDGVDDTPLETVRYGFDGKVDYRFDNVTAQYAYNLDLAFYRPDRLSVAYQVFADDVLLNLFVADTEGGATVESNVVVLNSETHGNTGFVTAYLPASVLVDESVQIRVVGVKGGVVADWRPPQLSEEFSDDFHAVSSEMESQSEEEVSGAHQRATTLGSTAPVSLSFIQLKRGGRIFIDCGGSGTLNGGAPADPPFSQGYTNVQTGIAYGYVISSPTNQSFAFGNGPSSLDTVRYAPAGKVSYKFAGLNAAKAYVIRLTMAGEPNGSSLFSVESELGQPELAGHKVEHGG